MTSEIYKPFSASISKYTFLLIFIFLCLGKKLSAQRIEIVEVGLELSAEERKTLNKLIDYEVKVYNGMFNTLRNDSVLITINLYGRYKDFNNVRKTIGNYAPTEYGFYTDATKQSYVHADKNYIKTVLHEASHCLLRHNQLNVPKWMHEGIAVFFGALTSDGKEIYVTPETGYIKYVKQLIQDDKVDMRRFLNEKELWNDKKNFQYLYGVSYSIIYFIIKSRPQAMNHIISLMQKKGSPAGKAVEETFGGIERFEQAYKLFYKYNDK